ncbi:GntR family transcriptional regulator [Capillimicrobium parvum]|uniref:GntR family transcriptional regulator n=1 Tax=Capillimicrobium parvum TaxID=2884022 RepID=UPI00216B2ECE|nr:GntR family transcriptional regulator [Capillimicrobium parvum]
MTRLREAIIFGDRPPGSRLLVAHIAREEHASVATVVQALRELEAMGLIVRVSQRGARVSELSLAELAPLAAARRSMSLLAIRRAAERFTPADARRAETALMEQERALRAGELRTLVPVTTEFHEGLYAAAQSPWLSRSLHVTHECMEHYLARILVGHPGIDVDYSGHREVLDACVARDADEAVRRLDRHLGVLVDFFERLLDAAPALGAAPAPDASPAPGGAAAPHGTSAGPASHRDWAAAELLERILSGELEPGAPLRLERLADLLGTGVFPVREALRELEALGVVEHVPNRGARVVEPSPEDLADLVTTRLALEPVVAGHAARAFTPADDALARGWVQRHAEAVAAGDARRARAARRELHFTLYRAAGAPRLLTVIRPVWTRAELHAGRDRPGAADDDTGALDELRAACAAHDAPLAERLLTARIRG